MIHIKTHLIVYIIPLTCHLQAQLRMVGTQAKFIFISFIRASIVTPKKLNLIQGRLLVINHNICLSALVVFWTRSERDTIELAQLALAPAPEPLTAVTSELAVATDAIQYVMTLYLCCYTSTPDCDMTLYLCCYTSTLDCDMTLYL